MRLNKQQLAVLGVLLFIILITGGIMLRKGNTKTSIGSPEPTEAVVPTIDSSVSVDLTSTSGGKEVSLEIKGIPSGTQAIDYELSYQT